ncbi:MAG: SUMF1/EgtB/PvdO family nonheme iron enzyme [Myxococcota bacterium]|nr:SUMF1/EgtB/PvdO family nonheme iron enzyme [Myxococcota bacterium]
MWCIYHVIALFLLFGCTTRSEEEEHRSGVRPEAQSNCPEGMAFIPGGEYLLGRTVEVSPWTSSQIEATAPDGYWALPNPAEKVTISEFCIDRFEYPNERGQLPRFDVNWDDSVALCRAAGKRLPTRLEWQAAAQGTSGRRYSYGNTFDEKRCNTEVDAGNFSGLAPAGKFKDCVSPEGVYDLDGNLSEWVATDWEGPWYDNKTWGGPSELARTLMGGTMWPGDVYGQDATSRHRHRTGERWRDDGFRCALTPGPAGGDPAPADSRR